MKKRTIIIALLWAGAIGIADSRTALAQESGTIQATATIIAGITIIGSNDLVFGTVLPGVNKSIDKATSGFAGEWQISNGTANSEISITLTLPDSLQHALNPTGMRIVFGSTDASYDDGTGGGQTAPAGVFDPNGPVARRVSATGGMLFWIGGTVMPRLTQTGGDYASDVTMTVAYTGN
jgi:hypothetical protein